MALTYSIQKKLKLENARVNLVRITFDNAYAAGGYVLDGPSCGVGTIVAVLPVGVGEGAANTGALASWDPTNKKLKLYKSNTAAVFQEIAAADLNGVFGLFAVVGDAPTG